MRKLLYLAGAAAVGLCGWLALPWLRPDRVAPNRGRNVAAADDRLRAERRAHSGAWTPPSMWRRGR